MIILNYCLIALIAGVLITIYALIKTGKMKGKIDLLLKIISGVLIAVFAVRYMWAEDAIQKTLGLTNDIFDSRFVNAIAIIFNWLIYGALILAMMYPFFSVSVRKINILVRYYVLPVSIIYLVAYFMLAKSIVGVEAFATFQVRTMLMAIEVALMLFIAITAFVDNGYFHIDKGEK